MPSFLDISDYTKSQISRLLTPKGLSEEKIKLREESCFGNGISPCEKLLNSEKYKGMHICGGCGCGENKLLEFAIHRFPYLVCPLGKPGFDTREKK